MSDFFNNLSAGLHNLSHIVRIGAGGTLLKERAIAGPWKVIVGVTDLCNYKCVMCREHSYVAPDKFKSRGAGLPEEERTFYEMTRMGFDTFCALVDDLDRLGTRSINISGKGEPLSHGSILPMIEYCTKRGMNTSLTSNGLLLDRKKAEFIVENGVGSMHFSINAGTDKTYRKVIGIDKEGLFEKVKGNIKNLALLKKERGAKRPALMLSFVLSSLNSFEVLDMVRFGIETGVDRVSFVTTSIYYESAAFLDISPEAKEALRSDITEAEALADRYGLVNNLQEVLHCMDAKQKDLMSEVYAQVSCYTGWYYSVILANGTVMPCCQCLRSMGNITQRSFSEVWNSETYNRFRKEAKNLPSKKRTLKRCQCSECSFVHYNLAFHKLAHPLSTVKMGDDEVFTFKDLKESVFK